MTLTARQFGFKKESTYGTAVTVDKFVEVFDATGEPIRDTIESFGIRPSKLAPLTTDLTPVVKGYEGSFSMPVGTKAAVPLLEWAMGSLSTGSPVSSYYPHTLTRASTIGKSLTIQMGRNYVTAGSDATMTYAGAKCRSMTISGEVDSHLAASFDWVAQTGTTATARATASYASSQEYLPWHKVTCTIGGSSVNIEGFELTVDNNLRDDRYKMAATVMDEPLMIPPLSDRLTLSGISFDAITHYNRIVAAAIANATVEVIITCTGNTDTTASLTITCTGAIAVSGALDMSADDWEIKQNLEFVLREPTSGSNTPVKLVYNSLDAT